MNNPYITDKDWEELEHGPFIYSDDIEYIYECSTCKKTWDESEEPKCACLDENEYDDELISFEAHKIKNIPINSDNKLTNKNKIEFKDNHIKKLNNTRMDTKYLDELILHEYGTHNINKYNDWTEEWYKWLKR